MAARAALKGFVCLVGLYCRAGGLWGWVGGCTGFLWVGTVVGAGFNWFSEKKRSW